MEALCKHYQSEGYAVIPGFLDGTELHVLRQVQVTEKHLQKLALKAQASRIDFHIIGV